MNFMSAVVKMHLHRVIGICIVCTVLGLWCAATLRAQTREKQHTVSGRVVAHNNPQQGLSHIPVTLTCNERTTITDSTGHYVFVDVPQGRWYVHPAVQGLTTLGLHAAPLVQTVVVNNENVVARPFVMRPSTYSIYGKVTDGVGQPIENVVVQVFAADGTLHSARSDERGIYRIGNLSRYSSYRIKPVAEGQYADCEVLPTHRDICVQTTTTRQHFTLRPVVIPLRFAETTTSAHTALPSKHR